MEKQIIRVYTDGSCHTQLLTGAWAAILFIGEDKIVLEGVVQDTTHNRMELQAVITAIDYLDKKKLAGLRIEIFSDSQYVVNLTARKEKLKQREFITNKGTPIQNEDLVKQLIMQIESHDLGFTKIKAHQKDGDAMNREVDLIVRKAVRKNTFTHEYSSF